MSKRHWRYRFSKKTISEVLAHPCRMRWVESIPMPFASLRGCFYFRPQRYANTHLRGLFVVTICIRRLRANRWQKRRLYLA